MANLFDYLEWRGDLSFEEDSLNKIDLLLLSHLTYSIFDNLITEDFSHLVTLSKLAKDFKLLPDFKERINIGYLINKRTTELMFKCAKTRRFKNLKLCGYKTIFDEKNEEQFAALTFVAGDIIIICFRGTDDTFVGWKEDFNMSFMEEIPAQKDAATYLEQAAKALKGRLIIAGHSKGANLAVYAAVKADALQKRIDAVYNFDGPGFSEAFLEKPSYKKIEQKIHSYYPEFSVVGMVFHHPEHYEIVKSDGFAFWQHDGLTWQLKGKAFENTRQFNEKSRFFNDAFNSWIEKLSIGQKKQFVNALFSLFEASGVKTNNELEKNIIPATAKMIAAYASFSKAERREIHKILSLFKEVIYADFPLFKLMGITGGKNAE